MCAAGQLARVLVRLENLELAAARLAPVDCGAWARHGEPLHGDRTAVFEAGIADIRGAAAGEKRQLARHPLGVGVALADLEQQMCAAARWRKTQLLLHHEILGLSPQRAAGRGDAVGTWRPQCRLAGAQLVASHGAPPPSSTTACAAMPSARPRKPRPSVVVALMLTPASSMPRSRAIS